MVLPKSYSSLNIKANLSDNSIKAGTADVGAINDVYYGKALRDYDKKIEDITKQMASLPLGDGYGQKMKSLMLEKASLESQRSKYAGMPDLYDEETYAGGGASKFFEDVTGGFLHRDRYVNPVMERAMERSLLADPYGIDKLFGFTDLEQIYQSQNMLPPEVDLAKKYARYTDRQGMIQEYKMPLDVLKQYREDRALPRKGYTLFGKIDNEEIYFFKCQIGA